MTCGSITSWQIDGGKVETVTIFLASKISAICDCSHRIKRCLFLERKAMTKVDSILKSRDIILLTKVHIVKAMFFSRSHVQMWRLDHEEDWVPKNWCFLESPLGSKEIEQVNPKGINPEYSLEGLMLKLKLQYFGHLFWRADWMEKTGAWKDWG